MGVEIRGDTNYIVNTFNIGKQEPPRISTEFAACFACRTRRFPSLSGPKTACPLSASQDARRALPASDTQLDPKARPRPRGHVIDDETIAVVGAGAWGTALAITAAQAGRTVRLWAREPEVAEAIRTNGENTPFLPDRPIPPEVTASNDLGAALDGAAIVLLVVPSQFLRGTAASVEAHLAAGVPVVICAKGIERGSGKLMSTIIEEEMPGRPFGVLSGPTFAEELAAGLPTAVTIASDFDDDTDPDQSLAARVALSLGSPILRPYISNDVTGVEVGGAIKNVIAIACGIATGLGFRSNTRAALIARGLEEMKSLAEALGGKRETVTGLSGIGDLMLTCSSEQSRNMSFGMALGRGQTAEEALAGKVQVVEGVVNTLSVTDLARSLGIELPICEAMRAVLEDGMDISEAVASLIGRPLKAEPKALDMALPHPAGEEEIAAHVEEITR